MGKGMGLPVRIRVKQTFLPEGSTEWATKTFLSQPPVTNWGGGVLGGDFLFSLCRCLKETVWGALWLFFK